MIKDAFRPKLRLVPNPKASAPAKAAEEMSPSPLAALFLAAEVPVLNWMGLSLEDRVRKAQALIDAGRTSMTEAAMVRRMMDAYALAFTAAQRALA